MTGTYDPQQNLVFFGTGNPGPDYYSNAREGDNLYTASLVALDADTGELALALSVHAARRPRLGFDPGAGARRSDDQRPAAQGRDVRQPQRVLLHARSRHRQSDRRQAVRRDDVGQGNRRRRPADAAAGPHCRTKTATKTCPDLGGGTNFMSPSYDPTTRLFFVTARETCAMYFAYDQKFKPGEQYTGGAHVAAARSEELRRAARDRSGDGASGSGSSATRRCRRRAC